MRFVPRRQDVRPLLLAALAAACGGGEDAAPRALTVEEAMRMVALENRGIGALERYDYTDAVAPLREALAISPKWVAGRFNLALALVHVGRDDTTEAAALLDGVLAEEPDHPHANFMAAWLAERSGPDTQEKALRLYEKAWSLTARDPHVGTKYGGMLARIDGREQDAIRVLEAAHAKRPTLIAPVYQLLQLQQRVGNAEAAAKHLERFQALKGEARAGLDRSTLGQEIHDAYGNMGRYSMALRDFGLPGPVTQPSYPDPAPAQPADLAAWKAGALPRYAPFLGAAVFDYERDGDLDLFVAGGEGPCGLLRNEAGRFTDVAADAGVAVTGISVVAAADFDVLEGGPAPSDTPCRRASVDLVLSGEGGLRFFKDAGGGKFVETTKESGLGGDPGGARALLALDADQEGDVDLLIPGALGQRNRLWANSGAGVFTEVSETAGIAGDFKGYGPAAVLDFDDDADLDLLFSRPEAPPALYANDRAMKFHEVSLHEGKIGEALPRAPYGVIAWGDRLVLQGDGGASVAHASAATATVSLRAIEEAPGGPAVACDPRGLGVRDLVFADGTWLPSVPGPSVFGAAKKLFESAPGANVLAFDADGDLAEEIVLVRPGAAVQVVRLASSPRGNAVVLDFEGVIRNDVQAGWSNLEGRGALVEVKSGVTLQRFRLGNPSGFGCSGPVRTVVGVDGAKQADFVRILWPDAVQHAILDVPAGQVNCIVEEQRRPDSCPLLFAWDGERWAYVTDFLGVGGIGFLVAPGVYGAPDATESVKVESSMVKPTRAGMLGFRAVEAMEEACYVDACDLQVIDHPADVRVHPDERFAGEPPFPDGKILATRAEILPVAARDEAGDVTERLLRVDRRWPDAFALHPRLTGAIREHALEIDFGDRLADVAPGDPIAFFAHGWIEYGYTRTSLAAAGEGFTFLPPTLEAWSEEEKAWRPLVANLGYPAGFPRVMTYDLTGKVSRATPRLRIRTSFEVYWDRIWLARLEDAASTTRVTTLAPAAATLRWVGYPREVKPDGRNPPVYDYGTLDPSMPWKTMEGDYTKFGDVLPLLTAADDMVVVYGKGEEIDLAFDPAKLPPLPDGWTRSYVLRFDGWCKGQELYTAHGFTVEPLPFHAMSNYPYDPAKERYPDDEAHRRYRAEWNTRRIRAPLRDAPENSRAK